MEPILGIDLGTTNSAAALIRDGQLTVLEEDGQAILPSVVGLDDQGQLLVGLPARNQWALAPERTVRSIKRKMGTDERVALGERQYSPQEISAIILRTLKERAERHLGQPVQKAVVTVPAFFNEQQREATRQAGELAGLDVARIINEPTAASLVYPSEAEGLERLLVYDLGGGTFDVSVVQVEQSVVEVLASHGDTQLGGDDFDQLLLDWVAQKFQEQHGVDLRESVGSKARALKAVEEAKKQLSFHDCVRLEEEFIAEKDGLPLHLNMEIERSDYEPLIEPLLDKTLVSIQEALSDAGLTAQQIDRVILVGGASRTPLVHRMIEQQLEQAPHGEVDVDLCVAMGAAIQGGMIAGVEVGPVLVDITPHTLGIRCHKVCDGVIVAPDAFEPLIRRNTPLPASRSETFMTGMDGQEVVDIAVFQGEHPFARQNQFVGEFSVEGLSSEAKQGSPIVVRFDLDLDGILTVTAVEKRTGLEERLTIENAMSRSRREMPAEAAEELATALAEAAGPRRGASAEPQPLGDARPGSPEFEAALARVEPLIDKCRAVQEQASPEDVEEMAALIEQLQAAIDAGSVEQVGRVAAQLEDIVFYLQDA